MQYIGKLYGNIGGRKYFFLGVTSEDWDALDKALTAACNERDHYYEKCEELEAKLVDMKIAFHKAIIHPKGIIPSDCEFDYDESLMKKVKKYYE